MAFSYFRLAFLFQVLLTCTFKNKSFLTTIEFQVVVFCSDGLTLN